MQTLKELLDLITLKKTGDCLYQGNSFPTPWQRVFGGQVLGQALHAAYRSMPDDRIAHSMHGYFILAGDSSAPIDYEVDTIRDGGSFSTRRVVAKQNGKAIFIMAASFQVQRAGFDHQITMPNVLPPEVLLTDFEQAETLKEIAPRLYRAITIIHPNAIEFRPVERIEPHPTQPGRPYRHVWMRSKEMVGLPLPVHHQLMAYASDYNLLTTASLPHQHKTDRSNLFFASLDHALYFHRDFRIDDWLLYATDSPSASNERGFSRGNIFDKNGRLVASVVQEGLIREYKTG